MPTGLSRPVSFFPVVMRQYLHTYLPYLLPAILLALLQQAIAGFSSGTQLVLLAIAMATTGIPHGALDYLLFRQQEQSAGRKHSLFRFLCYYLGLMVLYALLWWISPSLSLFFFLLIAAWHFADNDLSSLPLHRASGHLTRLGFGLWLLLVLVLGHTSELIPYLDQLVGVNSLLHRFAQAYQPMDAWVFWLGITGWPLLLWWQLRHQGLHKRQWHPLLTLMLLLVLCRQLPMILCFAVYFAIWHSLRSFQSIWQYLRNSNHWFRSVKQLVLPALPFVSGAFAGLAGFFIYSSLSGFTLNPLWIFISLITLPHGLLMHGVYEQTKVVS